MHSEVAWLPASSGTQVQTIFQIPFLMTMFKVGKNFKDSKLYLQNIKSLFKTDDTDIKFINYCKE